MKDILTCFLGLTESTLWVESVALSLAKFKFWVDPSDTNSNSKEPTLGYKYEKKKPIKIILFSHMLEEEEEEEVEMILPVLR